MIAVSGWFDEISETTIRDLWRALADSGVDDTLHTGPFRPHITMGVWEAAPLGTSTDRLRILCAGISPFPVTFRAIGLFPGNFAQENSILGLYLTPTVTPSLSELHERVHSAMHELASGPVSRHVPGRWEPHCTVAPRLPRRLTARAIEAVLDAGLLPFAATVNRIGLIDTPAEVELGAFPLG